MHPLLLLVTWAWFMSRVLCSDLSNFLTQLPSCAVRGSTRREGSDANTLIPGELCSGFCLSVFLRDERNMSLH